MIHIPKRASAIVALAAKEDVRAMNNVRIRTEPNGRFRIEATDGRALGIIRGTSLPSKEEGEAAQNLQAPESLLTESLIHSKVLTEVFKAVPKARKNTPEGSLGLLLASPEVLAQAGQHVVRLPVADGRFPDTDIVLPKAPAPVSITINPWLLIELLKVAAQIADLREGQPVVHLLLWPGKGNEGHPMGIVANAPNGLSFDGLLMPLS